MARDPKYTKEQKADAVRYVNEDKMTRKEAAEKANISISTLNQLLSGKTDKKSKVEVEPNEITKEMIKAKLKKIAAQKKEIERAYAEDLPKLNRAFEVWTNLLENDV